MNMTTLWDKTCALLMQEMAYVSYSTWIDNNLSPVSVDGDTLVLSISMESMRSMVQGKYGLVIDKCLTDAAGRPMKAVILTRAELEERREAEQKGEEPDDTDPRLNPKYTFESFVVGSGNRFAHAAALAVAESPAEAYNPLFIYGGVGLGKTHLMQAIGHFVHRENPDKRIMYMTSETFTNEMISAIQTKRTLEFRDRIRRADILMVDDIQFLSGKESAQEEMFHTFNTLHENRKQIVVTSDRPPKDIKSLEERLRTRLEWGLMADVQPPNIETRISILHSKSEDMGFTISPEVAAQLQREIDAVNEIANLHVQLVLNDPKGISGFMAA